MQHEILQEQFLIAFEAHNDAIFRFCLFKVSTREIAQDITQEVFTRYWQSLRKGDTLENERAFLYAIARNLVIDWYRKKKETSLDALGEAGIEFLGEGSQGITNHAEVQEVLSVIEQLDETAREVLLLRYVEGYSPKEIADILEETPNVISVRIHRSIKKVQELLQVAKMPTSDS